MTAESDTGLQRTLDRSVLPIRRDLSPGRRSASSSPSGSAWAARRRSRTPGDFVVKRVAGESILVVRTKRRGARRALQRLPASRLAARARPRAGQLRRRNPVPLPLLDLRARRRAPYRPLPRRSPTGLPVATCRSTRSASMLGRLRLPESHAGRGGRRAADARRPARRGSRAAPAVSARRAAGGAADRLRGPGQLEGDAGELQRVLPLRSGASGALPAGAGVQAAGRLRARLGARHSPSRGRLDLHRRAARPPARRSPGSTRTSGCATRAS